MSISKEKSSLAAKPAPAWVLGILSGVCVGAAFIGGWILAKHDGGLPASAARTDTGIKAAPEAPVFPAPETPAPAPEPAPAPKENAAPKPEEDDADADASPPEKADEEKAPAPDSKPARLEIFTRPGAKVFLLPGNGAEARPLGVADAGGRLEVAEPAEAGASARLLFEHADCEKAERENIPLVPGATTRVDAPLKLRPAMFTVIANPADAEVLFDGVSVGRGVVTLGDVAPRVPHIVEARLSGSASVRREVTFAPGESVLKRFNLTPPPPAAGDILFLGAMHELASSKGAVVRVDGKPVSAANGLVRDIAAGTRKVEITRDANGTRGVLWSRDVKIEPGAAASFDDKDAPPSPLTPAELKMARVILSLLDKKGAEVPVAKARVFFRDKPLAALKNGTWPVPTGVAGTLRVLVPGFATDARPLDFRAPGEYYITCMLQPAPEPAMKRWRTSVKAVSREDGVLVLRDIPGQVLNAGLRLDLVPPAAATDVFRLAVVEVKGGNVACQILPGQSRMIPPVAGDEVTVVVARPESKQSN